MSEHLTSAQLVKIAVAALEDIKGQEITVMEVGHLTSLFDKMIVASGDSTRQVKSLADNVREKLKEAGADISHGIIAGVDDPTDAIHEGDIRINPAFKPGMYADVELARPASDQRVLIPRQAVIDTGKRAVAFVSPEPGRFERREVHMGATDDAGMVEVLAGIKEGETVVTSSQFLLDSESSMREALAKIITPAK